MGLIRSYRFKKAIASLVLIANFLTPILAKAEWNSNTKASFVNFKNAAVSARAQPSPEGKKKVIATPTKDFVNNLLIEVQLDLKEGKLAEARGNLDLAKRGTNSLRTMGEDTTKTEALIQELDREIKIKEAEGLATAELVTETEKKHASPECDKEPQWVKNWRNGKYLWNDGNKMYVVGYAKGKGEGETREFAPDRARELYLQSMGKVVKLVTSDASGKSTTVLVTGTVSGLWEAEWHHHQGKSWESWVLMVHTK